MRKKYYPMLPQRVIDEQQIMPRKGGIYRLCGSGFAGKAMRSYAEAWTAMALMGGQYVHWIDGACRFNPERILRCFPPTLPEANYLLRNLFIGRGFTVHQFSSLVERIADELSITEAQLIVVDGPVAMHLDSQVRDREARTLLKRSMTRLSEIANRNNVAVIVITAAKPYSKRHKTLLNIIDSRCNQKLIGRKKRQGNQTKMWLVHHPSGASGFREQPQQQETLQQSYARLLHQQLSLIYEQEFDDIVLID
tara:strand:- start:6062 stop:6814 length:753 start_codon:yes stop_codon:yes gene_type:complete